MMRPKTTISFVLKLCGLLAGLGVAALALAQSDVKDPDYVERAAPPPPAFSAKNLIPLEMPSYMTVRFGVDPATLAITEGIVRYVMVATSTGGTQTAMYEGIRCATSEFKTYARMGSSGQWQPVKDPPWRELSDNNTSKHAQALARQGACEGRTATASSVAAMISTLRGRDIRVNQ
jgi:hypothetical protein